MTVLVALVAPAVLMIAAAMVLPAAHPPAPHFARPRHRGAGARELAATAARPRHPVTAQIRGRTLRGVVQVYEPQFSSGTFPV